MPKDPQSEAASGLAAQDIADGYGDGYGRAAALGAPRDTRFFGHPLGLSNLFFTELFERFSYYGMRALLVLFMTTETLAQDAGAEGGGGLAYTAGTAALIYGLYTSLVYLVNLPGGWIADRILGQRKSVLWGGIIITAGHFTMAVPQTAFFFGGLGLIILGTGLLKPNISVMVGQLYGEKDERRDAGFTIFYMGINMGAFAAPLVCGALATNYGWHYGFAAAGVGMAIGMAVYVLFGKQLDGLGALTPEARAEKSAAQGQLMAGIGGTVALVAALAGVGYLLLASGAVSTLASAVSSLYFVVLFAIVAGLFGWLYTRAYWTEVERKRLYLIGLLFVGAAVFWAAFEQAGSSLNLFAQESTDRGVPAWLAWVPGLTDLGGGLKEIPAAWFQSANAFFIFTIAPIIASLWVWLGRRNADPSSPMKFGIGLTLLGAGFLVMVGAGFAAGGGGQVSPWWLVATYLLHTLGELTLSPVGLSAMTKLAPARVSSLMMGVWFLAASVGNFIAGFIASFYEALSLPSFMGLVAAIAILAGVAFFFLAGPFKKMMARAEQPVAA